ncbi:hypothetical protein J3F84DRAFT_25146 [Trichoderma pleuroticola]
MDFVGARRVMLMMGHAGSGVFSLFFLFFTWLGYRHIFGQIHTQDETTDLFLQRDAQPSPKRGDFEYNHLLTYDVAFHASDLRLRGGRGVSYGAERLSKRQLVARWHVVSMQGGKGGPPDRTRDDDDHDDDETRLCCCLVFSLSNN